MKVHPLLKLAWGVVSVAYKVRTRNENYGDQRACGLIPHEGCQATDGTRLPHTAVNRRDGRELQGGSGCCAIERPVKTLRRNCCQDSYASDPMHLLCEGVL